MPLLVLAQTPPPLHGQSLMVATLVEDWSRHVGDRRLLHINLALSRDGAAIGRWQVSKLRALKEARRSALAALSSHPGATLYYVPAPGKLSAALRDCLLLPRLRKTGAPLVLHWHAAGLASWSRRYILLRPWLRRALGGAALSVLPSACVAADAASFAPLRTAIVANGVEDPFPDGLPQPSEARACRVLFLGACTREKGILDLAAAFAQWSARMPGRYELIVAGAFPDEKTENAFAQTTQVVQRHVRLLGVVSGEMKAAALASADIVCLPTHYPHEVQPLVAIEALAADRKVLATRWRGLPEMLEGTLHALAEPGDPESLAAALERLCQAPGPGGRNREVFLAKYTRDAHMRALVEALRPVLDRGRPQGP